MANYKLGTHITIGYDRTAYNYANARTWRPVDRDAVIPYSTTKFRQMRLEPQAFSEEDASFFRIISDGIGDPFRLACARYDKGLNVWRDSSLLDHQKEMLLDHVGYPITIVADQLTSPMGYWQFTGWIGDPINSQLEQFFLFDYDGFPISPTVEVLYESTSIDELPHSILGWEVVPGGVRICNINYPADKDRGRNVVSFMEIRTNPNRLDSNSSRQEHYILGKDENGNDNLITGHSSEQLIGKIPTRTGFSTFATNHNSTFQGQVLESNVYPPVISALNSTGQLDNSVIDPSKHSLSVLVFDRGHLFPDTPFGTITDQSANGLFEIPHGSGRLYNMVGFSESDDDKVILTFEIVARS